LSPRHVEAFIEPELHELLQGVDHVIAAHQQDDDVWLCCGSLDQERREVCGTEGWQADAYVLSPELLESGVVAVEERPAEDVVGGDEVEILSVVVNERL